MPVAGRSVTRSRIARGKDNVAVRSASSDGSLISTDQVGHFNWPRTERASCFWQIAVRQQRLLVGSRGSGNACFHIKTCLYDYVSAKWLELDANELVLQSSPRHGSRAPRRRMDGAEERSERAHPDHRRRDGHPDPVSESG